MNIFVSNDDGINSYGIKVLIDILKNYGEVYVSAPNEEKSGAGCSIKFNYIDPLVIDDKTVVFNCPPASCTEFGFKYFKDIDFDLCVTGINNGYNGSMYSLMSGTFGASLMATFIKPDIKSIIMSADVDDQNIYLKARNAIDYILKNDLLSISSIISVNLCSKEYPSELGFKVGKMYNSYNHILNDDEDYKLISLGYTSLTPIKNNLMDDSKIEILNEKVSR